MSTCSLAYLQQNDNVMLPYNEMDNGDACRGLQHIQDMWCKWLGFAACPLSCLPFGKPDRPLELALARESSMRIHVQCILSALLGRLQNCMIGNAIHPPGYILCNLTCASAQYCWKQKVSWCHRQHIFRRLYCSVNSWRDVSSIPYA